LGYKDPEVNLLLVDDDEITQLNRRYFRRNRPTNVIAFPMAGGPGAWIASRVLGDVVISAQTAERQAREAGKKAEEEILFLMVHGILHLLGFDHEGPGKKRQEMEKKERELFSLLMKTGRKKKA
jgi:probable rRNA maturation factor